MVALRIDWPQPQPSDANSAIRSGAKFYVYAHETTTPLTLYSDRDGLVTRANPVVADSSGAFPVAYVADSVSLMTLALKTSADVSIDYWNDYEPEVSNDLTALGSYVARAGGNSNRMTGPLELKEGAAIASATAIDLDAATGNTLHITGTTTIATITLAQGSRRTLIFDGALQLTDSANLDLGGANITTHADMVLEFFGEGSGVTRLIDGQTASGRSIKESVALVVGVGDETTAITTGTNKRRFRAPFAFTITDARASLASAQASGSVVTLDCKVGGNSIFSTLVSIDNNEVTSTTAATPPVLNSTYTSVADDALIAIDITQADGSTAAAGLKVALLGYRLNVA